MRDVHEMPSLQLGQQRPYAPAHWLTTSAGAKRQDPVRCRAVADASMPARLVPTWQQLSPPVGTRAAVCPPRPLERPLERPRSYGANPRPAVISRTQAFAARRGGPAMHSTEGHAAAAGVADAQHDVEITCVACGRTARPRGTHLLRVHLARRSASVSRPAARRRMARGYWCADKCSCICFDASVSANRLTAPSFWCQITQPPCVRTP